jgi:hypothetical protein
MKKIALALVFVIFSIFIAFSDDLTGFLNVPWGATKENAKSILMQKGMDPAADLGAVIGYTDIQFAGRKAKYIYLSFYNNQFDQAIVSWLPETNMAIYRYNSVKNDLISKYGTPDIDIENYTSPYYKGDGYEETALAVKKADITSIWEFDNKSKIVLTLIHIQASGINLLLSYINEPLYDQSQSKQQASNLDDL